MLRTELAVCERYQISHSHFLGGPDVWTVLDREKAKQYAAWIAEQCPSCGTRERDWKPEMGGNRFAFVGDAYRCPGCELKEMERENLPDDAKGIHVGLVPNPELTKPKGRSAHV